MTTPHAPSNLLLDEIDLPGAWVADAACRDYPPEWWFDNFAYNRAAMAICRRCDVRAECLDYALGNGEVSGVWGGVDLSNPSRKVRLARYRGRRSA